MATAKTVETTSAVETANKAWTTDYFLNVRLPGKTGGSIQVCAAALRNADKSNALFINRIKDMSDEELTAYMKDAVFTLRANAKQDAELA